MDGRGSQVDDDDLTLEAIFADIAAGDVQPVQPGEFSVSMFARAQGLSYNAADRMIQAAIRAGRVEAAGVRLLGGHRSKVYRRRE